METYFKYMSLSDLKRFLQILTYRELYAAKYNELNDPMEGFFNYSKQIDLATRKAMYDKRAKTYICSLSKQKDIGIMWSHYANEHRGCCIELEVTSKWKKIEVEYLDKMPDLNTDTQIDKILKCKSKQWEYEQEVRFIKTVENEVAKRPKLKIRIKKIWLGARVDRKTVSFLKGLVEKIYPEKLANNKNKDEIGNAKDKEQNKNQSQNRPKNGDPVVAVEKIKWGDLDFGYDR